MSFVINTLGTLFLTGHTAQPRTESWDLSEPLFRSLCINAAAQHRPDHTAKTADSHKLTRLPGVTVQHFRRACRQMMSCALHQFCYWLNGTCQSVINLSRMRGGSRMSE